jgi:hypothetical protein
MWPPGPPPGVTAWGLLAQMARDLPAALAGWRETYGDVVSLRMWPEHEIVLSDPQQVRELRVQHHEDVIRWERGVKLFSYCSPTCRAIVS